MGVPDLDRDAPVMTTTLPLTRSAKVKSWSSVKGMGMLGVECESSPTTPNITRLYILVSSPTTPDVTRLYILVTYVVAIYNCKGGVRVGGDKDKSRNNAEPQCRY